MTLFNNPILVTSKTGTYVKGVWTPGTDTTKTVYGSVQALSYRELAILDIGRKDLGKVKIYSDTALKVSQEGTENSGDIITWDSRDWEIIQALDFQNGIIPHYKYLAEFRTASVLPEVPT